MSFADFPDQQQVVQLLQRSLGRGRLGHGYLFSGPGLAELEAMARTLAKTLNCAQPVRRGGPAVDCCDRCPSCRKIDCDNHADIQWVRPESKLRVITIDQMRDVMHTVHLKPAEAMFKVAVIVGGDRLNVQAANAFLKTLEEPPPRSIVILLSTDPQRVLETIGSRCLRLNFAGETGQHFAPPVLAWLESFAALTAANQQGLLGRYRLLSALVTRLGEFKAETEKELSARSPLERHEDIDPRLKEKWEVELTAAIEAEHRRQRADLLLALQFWLRDVWLQTLAASRELLHFQNLAAPTIAVAARISPAEAMENLRVLELTQRLLTGTIQESLALEVGLLKLKL